MGTPDFLVLGHVTFDLQPDGTFRPGGTALYAALTAARLGCRAALYTSASPAEAEEWLAILRRDGVEVMCRPSPVTTTFQNRYRAGRRRQYLFRRAEALLPAELPAGWEEAPLVLLGPVAGEVSPAWVYRFPHSRVGVCLQGWLRGWGPSGRVHVVPWAGADWLPSLSAAFLSEEDVGPRPGLVEEYAARCPLLVLTRGKRGAVLFQAGRPELVPAFPATEVDPTGAGDVFAAAFLLRLAEGVEAREAARFAAAAAALSVQGPGVEAVPDRPAVERLLEEGSGVALSA